LKASSATPSRDSKARPPPRLLHHVVRRRALSIGGRRFLRLAWSDVPGLLLPFSFPLGAFRKVFANPPHKLDRAILGFEHSGSGVGDRDRKLESVIGFIPQFTVPREFEPNFLPLTSSFKVIDILSRNTH
jgi:hypothetical protein